MASCVAEAVRLMAPGVDLRVAAADLELPCGPGRPLFVRKASPVLQWTPSCALCCADDRCMCMWTLSGLSLAHDKVKALTSN